ncbi:MAG: TlpA family protein disulfide reductase [bacterium]|nr:TlpA family protein disulfide reductase [bacterium]
MTERSVKHIRKYCAGLLSCLLITLSPVGSGQARELLHPVPGTPQAQDFELHDLDSNALKLSDFKGHIVVVNFWATWCPPCRAEIPSMQRAWTHLKKHNVVILAIHVGGNEDKIWSFLTDFGVDFPVLIDANSKVSRSWPMRGLPTTFIIDPQGKIALRAIGGREWDDPALIKTILALAKQKK